MKVLELYSGIGGMHFALKGSTVAEESEIVMAVELNPICNEIYRHNFPDSNLLNKNISSLSAAEINRVAPDTILMSPPCQPFTRLGKQKDMKDTRNDSFLHFIKLLPELNSISHIIIENVKGFEVSQTRDYLLSVLEENNFIFEEYLLNPRQFGICNSRLRYYLLAKKLLKATPVTSGEVLTNPPEGYENMIQNMDSALSRPRRVEDILEFAPASHEWDKYLLTLKQLKKYFSIIDVVLCDSENSCCFTRGYYRCMERSGSVLSAASNIEMKNNLDLNALAALRLRFFTPREVARLMCFPDHFSFPDSITLKQKYKTLGNSINVFVVSLLISYLMKDFV